MRKFRATYLGALVCGWLLSFGSQVSWGYYPPLQATAGYDSHSVTYTVWNPQTLQGYFASHSYLGTVVDLQQHNGVIGWVVKDGTSYYVEWVTFDPALNTFQNDFQGPFPMVSHFQVMDGVVAYSILDSSGNAACQYATYDPAKGAWQKRSYVPYAGLGYSVLFLDVVTKGGVLVFSYRWASSGTATSDLRADIYDSALGKWFSEASAYGPEFIFTDGYLTCQSSITDATIYATIYHPTLGALRTEIWGYDPGNHQWYQGITKPMAYFVAQPKLGVSPLWVWFTDMSIGGTNWNWNFDDNSGTIISRSPYHTFTSPGNFNVTQQISGPNGNSTYSTKIIIGYPSTLGGKSLPAVLYLLMLTN